MYTKYYLIQSIGEILVILGNPNNQLTFKTYGEIQQAQSNPSPSSCNVQSLMKPQSSQLLNLTQPLHRHPVYLSLSRSLCHNQSQWLCTKSSPLWHLLNIRGWLWNPSGGRLSHQENNLFRNLFVLALTISNTTCACGTPVQQHYTNWLSNKT